MKCNRFKFAVGGIALLALICPAYVCGGSASDSINYEGITKPSEQRDLVFSSPGIVAEESVKEGAAVKKGQVLAVQDTTVEEAEKAKLELEANSALQEEAAKADYDTKMVDLKRKQKMFDEKVLGESELEDAKLATVIGEIRIRLAAQEQAKAKADLAEENAKIKLKNLISPIDGIVRKINTHVGEAPSNDATKPSMTVVKNDPIWVEVNLPKPVVMNLRTQQSLQVRFPASESWAPAEIIFVDPVADARSGTQLVRLQMPNPSGRQPGEQIQVKTPENVAEAR